MTEPDIREWMQKNGLSDSWRIAVENEPEIREESYTLSQVFSSFAKLSRKVKIIQADNIDNERPNWIDIEIPRHSTKQLQNPFGNPKPKTDDSRRKRTGYILLLILVILPFVASLCSNPTDSTPSTPIASPNTQSENVNADSPAGHTQSSIILAKEDWLEFFSQTSGRIDPNYASRSDAHAAIALLFCLAWSSVLIDDPNNDKNLPPDAIIRSLEFVVLTGMYGLNNLSPDARQDPKVQKLIIDVGQVLNELREPFLKIDPAVVQQSQQNMIDALSELN